MPLLALRLLPYLAVLGVIAAAWWWVGDLQRDLEAAQARASILEVAAQRTAAANQALSAQLAAVEEANAQRDKDYRGIAAALRAGQDARRAARSADPVLGEWAGTPHPAGVADGLRSAAAGGEDRMGSRPGAGGSPGAHADP
jgi:hypothetical protein